MFASSNTTMTRNSGAVKTVAISLILLGWLYTMYKYHGVSEKLENSRQICDRIRKEQEKLSSKLQDTLTEAEDHRQGFEREKKEYDSRLSSLQQQHKLLKAQHQDLESELTKVQDEKVKDAEDHKLQDEQRNQEYERFKHEKELEISSLKDELANLKRDKSNLEEKLSALNLKLKNSQQKFEVQLQEAQQRVLQLQQAVQQNQQANQQNVANQGLGQPVNPANQGQGQPVNSANQGPVQPVNSANQGLGQNVNLPNQGFGAGHVQQNQNINEYGRNPLNNQNLHPDNRAMDDTLKFIGQQALGQQPGGNQQQQQAEVHTMNAEEKAKLIDQNQQQHQVHPPNVENQPQHEKVQESTGSPINKTALEHRKDLEEHPNIRPPEVQGAEEIKYGEHKKEEKPSDSANVKPNLAEPVLQVAPPNENIAKSGNLVQGLNVQPPGGADGKNNVESQKEQIILPPKV